MASSVLDSYSDLVYFVLAEVPSCPSVGLVCDVEVSHSSGDSPEVRAGDDDDDLTA